MPPTDLRKKAIKKFEWQSLRNEIDVTNALANDKLLVSPTKAWLCTKAVTDFILDSHSNFQLFFGSLDFFVTFFIKEKSK